MSLGQIQRIVAGVLRDVNTNHIVSFAAALSYYFVMAFFPALITLAAIVAYLPIPDLFDTIVSTLASVAPPESIGLIRRIAADVITPSRGALLSFGLIGTLWTCSSGFAEIIEALDVAYDVPETRPFWKTRLLALELLFVTGTLVTLAFVFLDRQPTLRRISRRPPWPGARLRAVVADTALRPGSEFHGDRIRAALSPGPKPETALRLLPAGCGAGRDRLDPLLRRPQSVLPSLLASEQNLRRAWRRRCPADLVVLVRISHLAWGRTELEDHSAVRGWNDSFEQPASR